MADTPNETNTETSFTPIDSQEALDRIIGERLSRERAKYGDYQELKSKAAKFDELEEASKTELEKTVARAEKAEQELSLIRRQQQVSEWRQQVASEKGVPADVLKGESLEELQAHAEQLKTLLAPPQFPAVGAGFLPSEGERADMPLNSSELEEAVRRAVGATT